MPLLLPMAGTRFNEGSTGELTPTMPYMLPSGNIYNQLNKQLL